MPWSHHLAQELLDPWWEPCTALKWEVKQKVKGISAGQSGPKNRNTELMNSEGKHVRNDNRAQGDIMEERETRKRSRVHNRMYSDERALDILVGGSCVNGFAFAWLLPWCSITQPPSLAQHASCCAPMTPSMLHILLTHQEQCNTLGSTQTIKKHSETVSKQWRRAQVQFLCNRRGKSEKKRIFQDCSWQHVLYDSGQSFGRNY